MAKSIWSTQGGLYMGFEAQSTRGTPPPLKDPIRYDGDRHIITLGPNGSGKSRRSLLVNLVELTQWSALIVDPKGELYDMTHAHRAAHGSKIIRLDPFGEQSDGYNPIASLALDDDFADNMQNLSEANIPAGNARDPHWPNSAQDWHTAIGMWVRLMFPGTGSFADVRNLLALTNNRIQDFILSRDFEYLGKAYKGINAMADATGWTEMATKAARFSDIKPDSRELLSIISSALTATRWMDSRKIKADMAKHSNIDFGEMKRRPVTVYLILPARRLKTHATWLRLIISSVLQQLTKDVKRARVPVLLMLEEAAALQHLEILEELFALVRGMGIKIWMVLQNLGQLKQHYKESWETFIGNCGILQSFAPQELTTSEYLSKMTGVTTTELWTDAESLSGNVAAPSGQSASKSLNRSFVQTPFMLPQEIRGMRDGHTLIFSHESEGPVWSFLPYPDQLSHMRGVCRLDPAA